MMNKNLALPTLLFALVLKFMVAAPSSVAAELMALALIAAASYLLIFCRRRPCKFNSDGMLRLLFFHRERFVRPIAAFTVGLLSCFVEYVVAAPIEWKVADGGNGHFYEAIDSRLTWAEAKLAAETYLPGATGHLLTITNQAELDFLHANLELRTYYWLGGFQDLNAPDYSEPAGGWRWVTGEPFEFAAWSTGEPNNEGSVEHVIASTVSDFNGNTILRMNDGRALEISNGYYVEYPGLISERTSWIADSNGNWSQPGNWSMGVPNAVGAAVLFADAITAPRTVSADAPVIAGRLEFDSTHSYTVAGPNGITLDVATGEAQINVVRGSHTISAPLALADNTVLSVSPAESNLAVPGLLDSSAVSVTKAGAGTLTVNNIRAAALTVSGGTVAIQTDNSITGASMVGALVIAGGESPTARLDLNNNAAIINYTGTSPVTTVRQQILAGRGGAGLDKPWDGNGITSTAAAAANTAEPESRSIGYAENSSLPLGPYAMLGGQPVDDTSILMAFTRTGDANLDGIVNDDDVTIVGATYAPGVPQPSWALGDFDYNGFVDDDDVTLLGAFYDPSAPPVIASPPASHAVAAVPEPSTFILLGCSALFATFCVMRRRRR